MTTTVQDTPDQHRYEIRVDDQLAGFAAYQRGSTQIAFTHTEVDQAFQGQGLAGQLVAGALDGAKEAGLAVLPFCPYVRRYIARHSEAYLDLVPEQERERFGLAGGEHSSEGT